VAYFLLRLWLSDPPVESNKAASRVAGFLEARKADNSKYFADTDMWNSNSVSKPSLLPNRLLLLAFPPELRSLHSSTEVLVGTLNVSFKATAKCGCICSNNLLLMLSSGTAFKSPNGSQYLLKSGSSAATSSSTLLVTRNNGFSATLPNKKRNEKEEIARLSNHSPTMLPRH